MSRNCLSISHSFLCAAIALLLTLPPTAFAQRDVLYNFQNSASDGGDPDAFLISDNAGNLYGTTPLGGSGTDGTVFKLSRQSDGTWIETILHSFSGPDGTDLQGGLLMDSQGNLYGETVGGGTYGSGVIFELKPQPGGTYSFTVIHHFHFDGVSHFDGAQPSSSLLVDKAGNLFGTTAFGGTGPCFYSGPTNTSIKVPAGQTPSGCGTVFKLIPRADGSWSERVLYNFQGSVDGGLPVAGLIRDSNGVFYGTTWQGGGGTNKNCDSYYDTGCGVVFSLSSNAAGNFVERVLYTFQGQADGANPIATLVRDHAGNLYGTTNGLILGDYQDSTVFELSPAPGGAWTEKTLYSFDAGGNGYSPAGALVLDPAGNLYGTTFYGAGSTSSKLRLSALPPKPSGAGVVFKLAPSPDGTWTETVLHSFSGDPDGANPFGSLLLFQSRLYGTTAQGGSANAGTVFRVAP